MLTVERDGRTWKLGEAKYVQVKYHNLNLFARPGQPLMGSERTRWEWEFKWNPELIKELQGPKKYPPTLHASGQTKDRCEEVAIKKFDLELKYYKR